MSRSRRVATVAGRNGRKDRKGRKEGREDELENEFENEFAKAKAYARKHDLPDYYWIYEHDMLCTERDFKIQAVRIYHNELRRAQEWAAANVIQVAWRRAVSDPSYAVCMRRLSREKGLPM